MKVGQLDSILKYIKSTYITPQSSKIASSGSQAQRSEVLSHPLMWVTPKLLFFPGEMPFKAWGMHCMVDMISHGFVPPKQGNPKKEIHIISW